MTVSAPGKLMLFGEHAVVYGFPCIVSAINLFLSVEGEIIKGNEDEFLTYSADGRFLKNAADIFRKKFSVKEKVRLSTKSSITGYGLGSSSAVTVASVKLLCNLFNIHLSEKELFDLSYEIIRINQPGSSGFDIAAAIYGGTIYFDGETKRVEKLPDISIPLIVAFSGEKADTVEMVEKVACLKKEKPDFVENIFNSIGKLVIAAKAAIKKNDWIRLGNIMNTNHDLLIQLRVSTAKLDFMVKKARLSGAYGAKLSGAGGGDCIIILSSTDKKEKIQKAMERVGGEILNLDINKSGLKIKEREI